MIKKRLCLIFFNLLFFVSCATKQNCTKINNLCGIIVDENNKPVSDFCISCTYSALDKKTTYTNGSGIFVFSDLKEGKYIISGLKNNYEKIENKEIYFTGNSNVFCCQVNSLSRILENTNKYINNEDFSKALEMVNRVQVNENEKNQLLLVLYKTFIFYKLKDKESYKKCMQILKNNKNKTYKKILEEGVLSYEKF